MFGKKRVITVFMAAFLIFIPSLRVFAQTSLTIETSHNPVEGNVQFQVYGQINYKPQQQFSDLIVSLDVYNQNTGEIVYELTGADYPSDNSYEIGELSFPDYCQSGNYVLVVTLAEGWNIIDSAEKEITYIK